jgi:hypothetical protein
MRRTLVALAAVVSLACGAGPAGARVWEAYAPAIICQPPPPAGSAFLYLPPGDCTPTYNWDVDPAYDGPTYATESEAAAADPVAPAPVTPALPTWRNLYDWPNGHGYAGWHEGTTAPGKYGFAAALGGQQGLWLWPSGGDYTETHVAEWTYTAPGTTRISRVDLSFAYRNKLLAHHCLSVGLRVGTTVVTQNEWCKPVTPPDSQRDVQVTLVDPSTNPTSKVLFFRVRVDCKDQATCSKHIPALDPLQTAPTARLKRVDMTLVDDDLPVVTASGPFYDLAHDYINGRESYELTLSASDAGAGVDRSWAERLGNGEIAASAAPCDPTHNTPALDNRICPESFVFTSTVGTTSFPEIRNLFVVKATDLARNVGTNEVWPIFVDRTAPLALVNGQIAVAWFDRSNGEASIGWDPGSDPNLADGSLGAGVTDSRYRYSRDAGVWSDWISDEAAELVLTGVTAGETVDIEVAGIDEVGNASAPTPTSLTIGDDAPGPPLNEDAEPGNTCKAGGGCVEPADVVASFRRLRRLGRFSSALARPPVTRSYYEHNVNTSDLRQQGCAAARTRRSGVVILDFGRPAWDGEHYGTILHQGPFASSTAIRNAAKAFSAGFVRCAGARGTKLIVTFGTNNSCSDNDPHCSGSRQPRSFTEAGRIWAFHVKVLREWIQARPARRRHVSPGSADDMEPAWEPPFEHTNAFQTGYNNEPVAGTTPMYNHGSAERGFWTLGQLYRVSYGLPRNFPFPQIYYDTQPPQWREISHWGADNGNYGKMYFAGVLSQFNSGFDCGFTPQEGYDALLSALNSDPKTAQARIPYLSNIVCRS